MKRARSYRSMRRSTPAKRAMYRKYVNMPRGLSQTVVARPYINARTGGYGGLEMKFKDYTVLDAGLEQSWAGAEVDETTTNCISAVGQGDTESSRDGRVYNIHSVHVHGYFQIPKDEENVVPGSDHIFRLLLVHDTQTNLAQLNAEDVMLEPSTAIPDYMAFRNLQYTKRFKVLKDITRRVAVFSTNEGAPNLYAWDTARVPFKINKNFKVPIRVSCSGTGGTVGAVVDNSFHIIAVCTNSTGEISYNARIRFTG